VRNSDNMILVYVTCMLTGEKNRKLVPGCCFVVSGTHGKSPNNSTDVMSMRIGIICTKINIARR